MDPGLLATIGEDGVWTSGWKLAGTRNGVWGGELTGVVTSAWKLRRSWNVCAGAELDGVWASVRKCAGSWYGCCCDALFSGVSFGSIANEVLGTTRALMEPAIASARSARIF